MNQDIAVIFEKFVYFAISSKVTFFFLPSITNTFLMCNYSNSYNATLRITENKKKFNFIITGYFTGYETVLYNLSKRGIGMRRRIMAVLTVGLLVLSMTGCKSSVPTNRG